MLNAVAAVCLEQVALNGDHPAQSDAVVDLQAGAGVAVNPVVKQLEGGDAGRYFHAVSPFAHFYIFKGEVVAASIYQHGRRGVAITIQHAARNIALGNGNI